MTPYFPINNSGDAAAADPVFLAHSQVRPSGSTLLSYLANIRFCELGIRRLASQMSCTPFNNHVFDIVQLRAEEKVFRIDTPWVVATMQDKQALWNRSMYALPRYVVSATSQAPAPSGNAHNAISAPVGGPLPKNTAVGLGRADEPLKSNRWGSTFVDTHGDSPKTRSLCQSRCGVTAPQRLAYCRRLNKQFRPKLSYIFGASLLDAKSLQLVAEMAEQHDAQVWLERVGDGDASAVIIEDGQVAARSSRRRTPAAV